MELNRTGRAVHLEVLSLAFIKVYKDKMSVKNMFKENKRGNSHSGLVLNNLDLSRPKRSQLTIFIIIGIIIVIGILAFFLVVKPKYITPSGQGFGFENCVRDAIEQEVNGLGLQAGFGNPEFYSLYQDNKVGYLCYTNLYYQPCVMQKPFLIPHFQNELKTKIRERVDQCYSDSIAQLNSEGYEVTSGVVDYNVSLEPGKMKVNINAPTSISRESSQRYQKFNIDFSSPVYDMLMIATSLLQYEAKYGDADISSMMFLYPDFIIDTIRRDDGTTIYLITDKATQTKFQFASRSYAFPAGYTG